MDDKDREIVQKRYGDLFKKNMNFKHRTWGLKMYSNDCGSCIDLTKASSYQLMTDFNKSDFNINILNQILKGIVS